MKKEELPDCEALIRNEAWRCQIPQETGKEIFGESYDKDEGLTLCVVQECIHEDNPKKIRIEDTLMGVHL